MASRGRDLIRGVYIYSQFASIFCQFTGSVLSLWDYDKGTDSTEGYHPKEYALAIGIALTAAAISAYTSNKFQGAKIVQDPQARKATPAVGNAQPRNWKSNLSESGYLVFNALLMLTNNYFTISGIKAYANALINSGSPAQAILPLYSVGWTLVVLKTLLGDLPFMMSNGSYEAAEEIKKELTGSKEQPLISVIMKPWSRPIGIKWITTVGTAMHSLWDLVGLLLCIPPQAFIALYEENPTAFWSIMSASFILSIPLVAVNLLQTRFFEGEESKRNLENIKSTPQSSRLLGDNQAEQSVLHRLLSKWPDLYKAIRVGFYTQAPQHAFGDAMPAILLLRHVMQSAEMGVQFAVITPLALSVFLFSTLGTHKSEVKESLWNLQQLFEQIRSSRSIIPLANLSASPPVAF